MLFGTFKQKEMEPGEETKMPAQKEESAEKSSTSETFIKTPAAQDFIRKWSDKKAVAKGKRVYTKRGVVSLLMSLFKIPGLQSDKEVLSSGDELLGQLGGMDGLEGFLLGWKAKTEGLMNGIKGIFGGKQTEA